MQPWQQRVINERNELAEMYTKLVAFFSNLQFSELDILDKELLIEQSIIMKNYLEVLNKRIQRFK